jgi:hypothetical protein
VKVFGSYSFPMALNLGIGASFSSGKPLTPLASNPHPNYRNGGEIPEGPRGSGFETVDGFRTRTPFLSDVSLHADWTVPTGAGTRLSLIADVFNVFDAQTVLDYDNFTESSFGVPNPNFGLAARGTAAQFQTPRQVRFGIRYTF